MGTMMVVRATTTQRQVRDYLALFIPIRRTEKLANPTWFRLDGMDGFILVLYLIIECNFFGSSKCYKNVLFTLIISTLAIC